VARRASQQARRTALVGLLLVMAQAMLLAQSTEVAPAAAKPTPMASPTSSEATAGIYTDAQASRGDAVYAAHCAQCHMQDMGGREPAPQLAGAVFLSKWLTRSVGDLYQKIVTTMPAGSPASLKPADYADLVALILQANGFPAGTAELPADPAALNLIKINQKGP
jgi:S-disulfanyl-L-cysteine oxidoreductase SoxD